MSEPTIICPGCKTEIRLTESLAAPLIEATRRDYEARLAQQTADLRKHEASLKQREEKLSEATISLDAQVSEKLQQERSKIVVDEARKARLALAADLEKTGREVVELQDILKERELKLKEAQQSQLDFLRKQRDLDDAQRELELTVEKRIQEGLAATREQTRKEVEEQLKLKVSEKELLIAAMQKQIEELGKRAEQGSQQAQGEVQELELESTLRARFPQDFIEPVPKGEYGGDVVHRVAGLTTQVCGTILWECKRTKNWTEGWLAKLRDDQRAAKADVAILVSHVLPKGLETFDLIDGVWVASPRVAVPLASAIRQSMIELAISRKASEGQNTKMEHVYQYLTGPRFRQRVEAIVEAFTCMQDDLAKERKAITKQWAKREEQIERVMTATVGMYGDLQGIAGKSLQEIEGLELKALES
jgi:hypothetical protein